SGDEVAIEVASLRRAADDRAKTAEREKLAAEVRRRTFQRAVVAVAFVLLLGLLGTMFGLWQADAARRVAQTAEKNADEKRKAAEAAKVNEFEHRKKAEAETALANEVKRFLQFDVLRLADPATQQREGKALKYDADLRLRDVVLRAAERIEGKFKDRP